MKTIIILVSLFLVSCGGTTHTLETEELKFGPNFEYAAYFCDTRYGAKTLEAEACFLDYRKYTQANVDVNVNLESIEEYCTKIYTNELDILNCIEDLTGLFTNVQE